MKHLFFMALANGATTVSGYGWNLPIFLKDMPTRQDLDKVCSDIPIYFADEEGHKALACYLLRGQKGVCPGIRIINPNIIIFNYEKNNETSGSLHHDCPCGHFIRGLWRW